MKWHWAIGRISWLCLPQAEIRRLQKELRDHVKRIFHGLAGFCLRVRAFFSLVFWHYSLYTALAHQSGEWWLKEHNFAVSRFRKLCLGVLKASVMSIGNLAAQRHVRPCLKTGSFVLLLPSKLEGFVYRLRVMRHLMWRGFFNYLPVLRIN